MPRNKRSRSSSSNEDRSPQKRGRKVATETEVANEDAADVVLDPPPTQPKGKKTKAPIPEPKLSDFSPRAANQWKVGVHVSAAGGVENAVTNAAELGANAFALFLKSNRKWNSPPLSEDSVSKFRSRMKELQYDSSLVLPHSTYLINMVTPDEAKREQAYQCFADDLRRCEQLGLTLCNFHPGSTTGKCTREEGIRNLADCLNRAHKEFPSVTTVVECMAGSKNIIGGKFVDLKDIIELVKDKAKVGVCLDTCHMFSAGYELRTEEQYQQTMMEFDREIGFHYLKGMHLNDSKTPFGSGKDRHENIGLGSLGLLSFKNILRDERIRHIPLILETPGFDLTTVWRTEIEILNAVCTTENTPTDDDLVSRVGGAVAEVESNGWSAKGKVVRKRAIAGKPSKRKVKEEDDGDLTELDDS